MHLNESGFDTFETVLKDKSKVLGRYKQDHRKNWDWGNMLGRSKFM